MTTKRPLHQRNDELTIERMDSMASSEAFVDENRPMNKLAAFMRTNQNQKQSNQRALIPLQTIDTNQRSNPATLDDFDEDFDESPTKNEAIKVSEPLVVQPVVLSPILHNSDNSGYLYVMKSGGMKTMPLYDEGDDEEEGSTWQERSSTMHDHDEMTTTGGVETNEKKKNDLPDGHTEEEEEEEMLPGLLTSDDIHLVTAVDVYQNHITDTSSMSVTQPGFSSQIPSQMPSQHWVDLDASVVMVEGESEPWSSTDPDGDVSREECGVETRTILTDFIPPSTSPHRHHDHQSPSQHDNSLSSSLSSTSTSTTCHDYTSKVSYDANITTVHHPSPSSHQHTSVSPSGYIEFIPPPPPLPPATTTVPAFGTAGVSGTFFNPPTRALLS